MLPIFFMKKFNHKLWLLPVSITVILCCAIPLIFSDLVSSKVSFIFNYFGNSVSNYIILVAILSTFATSIYLLFLLGNVIWAITFTEMADYELKEKLRTCSKKTALYGGTEAFIKLLYYAMQVAFALLFLVILVWSDTWVSVRVFVLMLVIWCFFIFGFSKSLQQVKKLEDEDFIKNLSR